MHSGAFKIEVQISEGFVVIIVLHIGTVPTDPGLLRSGGYGKNPGQRSPRKRGDRGEPGPGRCLQDGTVPEMNRGIPRY